MNSPILNLSPQKYLCIASMNEVSLNINNMFYRPGKISKLKCINIFSSNKDFIFSEICANSQTLGDVELFYNDEKLLSMPIECPETIVGEGTPITLEGTYMLTHEDYFEKDTSVFKPSFYHDKTGKEYELVILEKTNSEFDKNIMPGNKVKIRGVKQGNKILLKTGDSKSIVKI
ncbi:MAG: hypothetical protein QXI33_03190 [Candidatus Pacearchaeota archaeon]